MQYNCTAMNNQGIDKEKHEFPHMKKDLLTIVIVVGIILSAFAAVKVYQEKSNFLAKISEKITSKYIK